MADIDLKTSTPDTSLPTTGFLFGADSQAASAPSVYSTQAVATTLLGSTTLSGATITADAPVLNMSQTWNNSGVTFTGLKFNATDTASNAASLLLDIGTGGGTYVSQFRVGKNGSFGGRDPTFGNFTISGAQARIQFSPAAAGGAVQASVNFNGIVSAASAFYIGSEDPASADVRLSRRGAANLRLGAADAAAPVAQTLSVQSVVAGTTNTAGANLTITGSQGTGTGAGGSIIFQVAPAVTTGSVQNALATALTIDSTRNVTLGGDITVPSGGFAIKQTGNAVDPITISSIGVVTLATNTRNIVFSTSIGFFNFSVTNSAVQLSSVVPLAWSSTVSATGTTPDVFLYRDTSNTLALRNGNNGQTFRLYGRFTDITNDFERFFIEAPTTSGAAVLLGTQKGATTGAARALEFQTDGTTRLTIGTTGNATVTGWLKTNLYFDVPAAALGGNGGIYFGSASSNGSQIQSTGAGILAFGNYVGSDFNRLQFGGTSASFPALKRSSASLIVRLADDTANAALESASLKTDAPTGGTAATWKLGVRVAATTLLDTTQYIEVDVGGTLYKLAVVTT